MSTLGGATPHVSVDRAGNFLNETIEGLDSLGWVQKALGPEQTGQFRSIVREIGVLAVQTSETGQIVADVERPSRVGIYVLGLADEEETDWSITLPSRVVEGQKSDPLIISSADVQRPADSWVASMYTAKGNPPVGVITIYKDTEIRWHPARLASNLHDLTLAVETHLHPEEYQNSHLPLVKTQRKLSAVHNMFAVLDSSPEVNRGLSKWVTEWMADFMEQGDEFDDEMLATDLADAFPNSDVIRHAVEAIILARIYGDPSTEEGGLPEVTNDLIFAYQRRGYLMDVVGSIQESVDPQKSEEQETAEGKLQELRNKLRKIKPYAAAAAGLLWLTATVSAAVVVVNEAGEKIEDFREWWGSDDDSKPATEQP